MDKRTMEEIQRDYTNACAKAGHLRFQIVTLEKDLDLLLNEVRDLNFEALSAAKKEEPKEEVKQ